MMFQIVVSFVIIFVGVGSVHAETAGTDGKYYVVRMSFLYMELIFYIFT